MYATVWRQSGRQAAGSVRADLEGDISSSRDHSPRTPVACDDGQANGTGGSGSGGGGLLVGCGAGQGLTGRTAVRHLGARRQCIRHPERDHGQQPGPDRESRAGDYDAYLQGNALGLTRFVGVSPAFAQRYAGRWIALQPGDQVGYASYDNITSELTLSGEADELVMAAPEKLTGAATMADQRVIGVRLPGRHGRSASARSGLPHRRPAQAAAIRASPRATDAGLTGAVPCDNFAGSAIS